MNDQGSTEAGSSRGTASDDELLKRFQPVFVLSVKEVKRLKKNEKNAQRRERNIREGLHSCDLCTYKGHVLHVFPKKNHFFFARAGL